MTPKAWGYQTADGILRTPEQIEAAFQACWLLEKAYAKASEDHGGDSSIRWEDVDLASEFASEALTEQETKEIVKQARVFNGEIPESEPEETEATPAVAAPLAPFEFKRPEDTEGGTLD